MVLETRVPGSSILFIYFFQIPRLLHSTFLGMAVVELQGEGACFAGTFPISGMPLIHLA